MPTIVYNIKTDFGASSAVGNGQVVTDAISIANGSTALHSTSSLFVLGDTGKYLFFGYPATGGTPPLFAAGQITYVSATQVTISNTYTGTTLTASSRDVEWGTDDAPAFYDHFNPAALAWQALHPGQIELDIPAGVYVFGTHTTDPSFTSGIKQLLVSSSSATIAGLLFHLGGDGQYQDNVHSARTATVSAGANSVTLTTSGLTSIFTAGQYALMTGLNMQGNGFPSNQHWFEFLLVQSIGIGTVTFATPMQNSYLSTWPEFFNGSGSEIDLGGPATLYALHPSWDTDLTFQGSLTLTSPSQIDVIGRSVVLDGVICTPTGQAGAYPTVSQSWRLLNAVMTNCQMEADKLVTSMEITGTTINVVKFQSSSIDLLTVGAGTTIGTLLGTPKKTNINAGATIGSLLPGPVVCGRADELNCTGAVINALASGAVVDKGTGDGGINNSSGVSMANGTITLPKTYVSSGGVAGPPPWAVPGTHCFWSDETTWTETHFRVLAVTGDATNIYVRTSLAGGFLTPPFSKTKIWIFAQPAPKFTCRGCSGSDAQIAGLNNAPAGAPLFSYQQVTYTSGAAHATAQPKYSVWGNLTSLSINVTHAYAGAGALTFSIGASWPYIDSTNDFGTSPAYDAVVDAKIGGERIVQLSGVTNGKGSDSGLAAPDSVQTWFTGTAAGVGAKFSADVSGTDPAVSVTVTFQTDQRITQSRRTFICDFT